MRSILLLLLALLLVVASVQATPVKKLRGLQDEDESEEPTVSPEPTEEPTKEPTKAPTIEPTDSPEKEPSDEPTKAPTNEPTILPTKEPTFEPTISPEPTRGPTDSPTDYPTTDYQIPLEPVHVWRVGNKGTYIVYPLEKCMGDCDEDRDCAGGLICYDRNPRESLNRYGCTGARGDDSDTDYCVNPVLPQEVTDDPNYLRYVGNSGDDVFPLKKCQGDCDDDDDDDCEDGLICYDRSETERVPGCSGGEYNEPGTDYCTTDPTDEPSPRPTPSPTPYPAIELITPVILSAEGEDDDGMTDTDMDGDDDDLADDDAVNGTFTVAAKPPLGLNQCQGMCQSDNDCAGSLICYKQFAGDIPFCQFDEDEFDGITVSKQSLQSFCSLPPLPPTPRPTNPPTPTQPTTPRPTPWPTPPTEAPPEVLATFVANPPEEDLGRCEGDCDSDSDCEGNLVCHQRGDGEEAPGCYFSVAEGGMPIEEEHDLCIDPKSEGNLIRLRMYWQEGYRWQEDTSRQYWCMRRSGSGVTVGRCSSSSRQVFELVYLPSGEALIKSDSNGECLQGRSGENNPRFEDCDPDIPEQRFIPQKGGWQSNYFELTQIGREDECLTQHHHPRSGEEVEMRDCVQEREYTTAGWMLW